MFFRRMNDATVGQCNTLGAYEENEADLWGAKYTTC